MSLVKLLGSYRDKRAEPALKKAFEEFAKSPKTTQDEQDIKWAARAQEELKLAGLQDALLQAFTKLKASTMLGGVTYRDITEAMVAAPSRSDSLCALVPRKSDRSMTSTGSAWPRW